VTQRAADFSAQLPVLVLLWFKVVGVLEREVEGVENGCGDLDQLSLMGRLLVEQVDVVPSTQCLLNSSLTANMTLRSIFSSNLRLTRRNIKKKPFCCSNIILTADEE
jgi:hypothetical protein